MTTSTDTDGLVERLRKATQQMGIVPSPLVTEAADTIEAQAARIAVLEGALERITRLGLGTQDGSRAYTRAKEIARQSLSGDI